MLYRLAVSGVAIVAVKANHGVATRQVGTNLQLQSPAPHHRWSSRRCPDRYRQPSWHHRRDHPRSHAGHHCQWRPNQKSTSWVAGIINAQIDRAVDARLVDVQVAFSTNRLGAGTDEVTGTPSLVLSLTDLLRRVEVIDDQHDLAFDRRRIDVISGETDSLEGDCHLRSEHPATTK